MAKVAYYNDDGSELIGVFVGDTIGPSPKPDPATAASRSSR
jgi:hypothetical protein